jgi:hypothetical protein
VGGGDRKKEGGKAVINRIEYRKEEREKRNSEGVT